MTLPSIIAVDGPAGSGKSTVLFAVAQRISYLFVDTGAFYRAVTFLALEEQLDLHDTDQVAALCRRTQFDMTPELKDDGRQFTFLVDGRDITSQLNTPAVDKGVSIIAASDKVRACLLEAQRKLAAKGHVIMVGRDIGTVVLPDADLKIFITASLEERAARRSQQRARTGEPVDYQVVIENLRQRDQLDSSRESAPLRQTDDAVLLDTSALTFEESVEAVLDVIRNWQT